MANNRHSLSDETWAMLMSGASATEAFSSLPTRNNMILRSYIMIIVEAVEEWKTIQAGPSQEYSSE